MSLPQPTPIELPRRTEGSAPDAAARETDSAKKDDALVAAFFGARDAIRERAAHDALCKRAGVLLDPMAGKLARNDDEQNSIYSLAVEQFLKRLAALRDEYRATQETRQKKPLLLTLFTRPPAFPITHLGAFLRHIAANARRDYLVNHSKEWRQLYQNLRNTCRANGSKLALWVGTDKRMIFGREEWIGRETDIFVAARLRTQPDAVVRAGLSKLGGDAADNTPMNAKLWHICLAVTTELNAPVAFADLVKAAATVKDVEGAKNVASLTGSGDDSDAANTEWDIADPGTLGANPATVMERHARFRVLWDAVCSQLNLAQRKSFLPVKARGDAPKTDTVANLRETAHSVLELFHITCALKNREMASAFEKSDADFEELWRTLIWEDARIASDIPASPDMVRKHRQKAGQILRPLLSDGGGEW